MRSLTTSEQMQVMSAFVQDKIIQRYFDGNWKDDLNPIWNWEKYNYRVKPTEKPPRVIYAIMSANTCSEANSNERFLKSKLKQKEIDNPDSCGVWEIVKFMEVK